MFICLLYLQFLLCYSSAYTDYLCHFPHCCCYQCAAVAVAVLVAAAVAVAVAVAGVLEYWSA